MNNQIRIYCTNIDKSVEVPIGLTLSEIAEYLEIKLKYTMLGAVVNNKYIGLNYRVYQPKRITFFDITHVEGMRIYTRSLIFILYVAVRRLMPDATLSVMHSVSRGLYCEVHRGESVELQMNEIANIKDQMEHIVYEGLPIVREEAETETVLQLLDSHLVATANLLRQRREIYTTVHHLGEYSAVLYGELVPNTKVVDMFDLKPFYNGMLLQLPQSAEPEQIAKMIRQDKMFATFREFDKWQQLMNIRHVADLNHHIDSGHSESVVQIAEALHEKKLADIADMIAARRDKIKLVLIAGPSSSGKTTFSKRLGVQMMVNGIRPVTLSIDNYFVNREETPRDENGDYDFETIDAVDTKFFNQQVLQLMNGEEIEIPKFSFEKGQRYFDGERLRLNANDMLVIEGTHGLTPQLSAQVPVEAKFRIYVAPLASINFDNLSRINTTDNRLIRRIVRDYKYRGYSAEDTLMRWASVRRGEDKYIYPNQEEADVMFNSALFYELSVLKAQAEPILLEVAPNSAVYSEARRLLKFLSYIKPMEPRSIPPTSILREFLGGSSFTYD